MKILSEVQIELRKADGIEFVIKNEPWVKYKLEDGTLLFVRLIITKFYKTKEYDANGQPIYAWASQNLFVTMAPDELRGEPSSLPLSMNPADHNTTPLDFERSGSEEWNVYELGDNTVVRIKLEITNATRTDKFAADGDPFYIIGCGAIPRVKVPTQLLRKQLAKSTQPRDVYK